MIKKLKEIKNLIEEIDLYAEALDILTNYDSKVNLQISSSSNSNTKKFASVSIPYKNKEKLKEEILATLLKLENEFSLMVKDELI